MIGFRRMRFSLARGCPISNGLQSSAQFIDSQSLNSPWFYGAYPFNLGTSYASH
jgi:hypothetical protein